jgi:hypothetical protein
MATKICTTMRPVVGPASRSRLGPMGAVKRGWDRTRSGDTAHMQLSMSLFLSADRKLDRVTKPA